MLTKNRDPNQWLQLMHLCYSKMRLSKELQGCSDSDVFNWGSLRQMIRKKEMLTSLSKLFEK